MPVYDSIAVVIWESLLLAGLAPDAVKGWGWLFADPRLQVDCTQASKEKQ